MTDALLTVVEAAARRAIRPWSGVSAIDQGKR